jgi:hypothetical protein
MLIAPIPIARELVPGTAPHPELDGLTRLRESMPAGLPHAISLEGLRLVLVVPTGLALTWRAADPTAVVTQSAPELDAHDPAAPAAAPRVPARLILLGDGDVLESVALAAGRRLWLPDTGSAAGVRIDLVVLGWDIRAGSLRGPGDVGSWIEFAWRVADRAADEFAAPRVSADVLERQPDEEPAPIGDAA